VMETLLANGGLTLGAKYADKERCEFCVWAPLATKAEVHILKPKEQFVSMERMEKGYYRAVADNVAPGSLYYYRLDTAVERPDPASRFQPQGVHGPSQVQNTHFDWGDSSWFGLPLQDYVIYELHVGVFTPEGTFDAIITHLPELKATGITAIELMPVAQFPGSRNWGYDGVFPYAVQNTYGGPDGLKRLVNACHQQGLAVILDVVYNHLGPEGNYFSAYGPYFTDRYRTPWGTAVNYDGPHSDEVKYFFIQNALYWINEFHIDSLRLDALHAIVDTSVQPFIRQMAAAVHALGRRLNRRVYLFGESDRNDTIFLKSPELGGYGLDVLWNDDFHHALHVMLTGEQSGYYQDFLGISCLQKAYREGFIYSGQYSVYRQRSFGSSSGNLPAAGLLVFSQNHDQVGNRMLGERLSQLVSFEKQKLAAGAVLLSPYIPLVFMGEEYGEKAPFLYFIEHSDAGLIEATRQGRRREFVSFAWQGEPPDPQDQSTFFKSKLDHTLRRREPHSVLYRFYQELLRLRRESPALALLDKENMQVTSYENAGVMVVRRWAGNEQVVIIFNFSDSRVPFNLALPGGCWRKQLDSSEAQWIGHGGTVLPQIESGGEISLVADPLSLVIFRREEQ